MTFSKTVCDVKNKNACGKPETPKVGLGGTDPYKTTVILINMSFIMIHTNKYQLVYPIGIK